MSEGDSDSPGSYGFGNRKAETQGPAETEYGIRGLYGSTPAEPIPMLMDMTVMATNCLMGKDIVWSGGLKKRRAQCSSFLIVVQ